MMHASGLLALQLLALVHVHIAEQDDVSEACKKLEEIPIQGEIINMAFERPELNCKTKSNDIAVWTNWKGKSKQAKVKVRACPGVSKIWMFVEDDGKFIKATPGGEIATCRRGNDTVILSKLENADHQGTIIFEPDADFKIFVIYKGTSTNDKQLTIKRFKLDKRTQTVSEFSIKDCGSNRSCIRFGKADCQHMECDYFLSYFVVNKEFIVVEMSAKTDGWVAVGFSSDAYMGGGDDVIACKLEHTATNGIKKQALWNLLAHSRPMLKDNSELNLTDFRWQNGYIYCNMTRPLSVQMERHLDLTNDWFQLYATGPIDASGQMLKHVVVPKTSASKLTVLRHVNRLSAWSGSSGLTMHVLILLLAVISPSVS